MNAPQPEPTGQHLPTVSSSAPSVELHIDELVLHDFAPGTASADIGAAVEHELTRLLIEQGLPTGLEQAGAVARLDGGSVEIDPDASPAALGVQIAQAIYGGLR